MMCSSRSVWGQSKLKITVTNPRYWWVGEIMNKDKEVPRTLYKCTNVPY